MRQLLSLMAIAALTSSAAYAHCGEKDCADKCAKKAECHKKSKKHCKKAECAKKEAATQEASNPDKPAAAPQ